VGDLADIVASDVSLEDIRSELDRVLASAVFSNASRLSRFLRFVVEEWICGRADALKEYTIGLAVFDRGTSFDPRTDSVVRVEARRLRGKLAEYYRGPGAEDPVRIRLPKGRYVPSFEVWRKAAPEEKSGRGRPLSRGWLAAAAAVVAVLLAAALWPRGGAAPDGSTSIAVLPFVNMSAAEENEYFSSGLVDEITQTLSRIEGLRVAARTSAYQFENTNEDIREIARKLNVETLLEGSVRQMGDELRVTAQLINANDGFHIWAQTYDCDPDEAFQVQEQISRDIARALALQLRSPDNRPLAGRHSTNAQARAEYLKGRYFWNNRTAVDIRRAVLHFGSAIELDPGYALAHAALADAYAVMAFNDQAPLTDSVNQARTAALRALELDDGLAEAYATLAFIKFFHDWSAEEALDLYRQAIALNPNYSTAHQWYGLSLVSMGRFDEALESFTRAELLDPLSLIVSTDIAVAHYYRRDFEQSLDQLESTLAMGSGFFHAHLLQGANYVALGKRAVAIPALERAVELSQRDTDAVMRLAHAQAVFGPPGEEARLLAELIATAERRGRSAYQVASVYAGLGKVDEAMEWLGTALKRREANLTLLGVDPIFDGLREQPAFQELLGEISTVR
jgi:TolB-like protein/Tfp pilus assembly protein PilF